MRREEKVVGVVFVLLSLLMLWYVFAQCQTVIDTGWRTVPAGASVEEFFYEHGSATDYLSGCTWIFVRVSAYADTTVTIRRSSSRRSSEISYIDAATQIQLEPGSSILLTGRDLNMMLVTRLTAADPVWYIAGKGSPPPNYSPAAAKTDIGDISMLAVEGKLDSMIVLANQPTPVAVAEDQAILGNVSWTQAESQVSGPAVGLYVDGAKGILINGSFGALTRDLAYYHNFAPAANDTSTVYLPVDSLTISTATLGTADGKFSTMITCPGGSFVGYYYGRLATTSDTTSVRRLSINATVVW